MGRFLMLFSAILNITRSIRDATYLMYLDQRLQINHLYLYYHWYQYDNRTAVVATTKSPEETVHVACVNPNDSRRKVFTEFLGGRRLFGNHTRLQYVVA